MRIAAALLAFTLTFTGLPAFAQTANPSADERIQKAIENIDKLAQRQIDNNAVVGLAVGIVYKDKVVFAKGYGLQEVGKDGKVDADTVFQLASVSKPISASVVAELVGEGKISWDSKIQDLDPPFTMHDSYVTQEITIRDLYSHRSGLPEHAGDLLEDMGYDREQVLHRLRYQRPYSSFRSHYAYTNFGLTEAAVAAAKPYGLSWEEAAESKLFKPLGMGSSATTYASYAAKSNKAPGHVLLDGKWQHKYERQPDAQSPAGGISSSVNDMTKWMRMVLNGGKFEGKQIVAEKALLETEHPQMLTGYNHINGLPTFYGLGFNVSYDENGRLHLGHSGGFALGHATAVSLLPSEHVGIVVLTNCYPVGVAEAITFSFVDDTLYSHTTQDWFSLMKKIFSDPATLGLDKAYDYSKAAPLASQAQPSKTYIGEYHNEFYGDISIVDDAGNLSLLLGPQKTKFALEHYDHDTFTYLPPGENSNGKSGVSFCISGSGLAQSVVIENLNEQGQGVFEKKQ